MESTSSNSGRSHFDLGIPDPNNSANHAATRVDDKRLAGLGLDLNTQSTPEHIEVLASPAQGAKKAPMVVDEMGRWMIDTQRKRLQGSWFSEATAEGSENGRGRWEAERASTASLSTATEASFTSHSNSSTWDSSFAEVSSPPSGAPPILAESQFISTPASSIGFSGNSEKQVSNVTDPLRWASERRSDVATPEVAMHDFSEFGQSVSIEQMAEERWRTWPRSSDAGMSRARLSTSAASLGSAAIPNSLTEEPRTSSDSLSVSTSSTRSRLMAEPYNKNMRSGRPGSSASTSSRSSIGNAAALDAQQTSSGTGPTRPRSLIAAGSLRMSSTTRTGSSGGVGPDASQIAGERVPSTAMALRRARGMSHSIFSSSGGSSTSSAMKSTKSADAFIPNASFGAHAASSKHSAALPRSATSLEGSRIVLQKPDSILGTSSYSDSSRPLGAEHKTKARVGFNEVSAAVDTLRMFLKQKSDNEVANSLDESPKQIKEGSSPSKPSRTLRRAKGVLPPRGAVSHVDEFGSLQTIASPSNVSLSNDVSGPPPVHHHRSQSLGGPFSLPKHATPPSLGRQDDKLAVLEDLSERVMRLKAKTEMERERHAAASMPPPTARPASMMHQRTQSSMTRREMHEEYLRKRASDT
ncbi:hypothetical protein EX895_003776 [Sporisorium graminicola]|uniref:Uncharacterized protein n=1 Tax=Sporisorium graminicola TaxID=280036 RepID=A0A4V6ETL5_9BASI|nr:hypothetical protein EX895_003776 [Sporisorium graminicola]TKY87099.1 hypothetical protein EX895_003776 [Sporisorium graminicola]